MARSYDSVNVWTEIRNGTVKLFVGLVQILSDRMITKLKNRALVCYLVYEMFLNFSARIRNLLIGNGYMEVASVPVCYPNEQREENGNREPQEGSVCIFKSSMTVEMVSGALVPADLWRRATMVSSTFGSYERITGTVVGTRRKRIL